MSFLRAHIDDKDFASRFAALQQMKREQSVDVNEAVATIIDDVRARGDLALIELTQ
ncbi:MAG TPA: histidinol dehydrogenase, partial [Rhodobiaceae bacterium]|nr:histidinol dehydrogenase [Rhodobiaceae bacterium]